MKQRAMARNPKPKPPKTYRAFVKRYPKISQGWDAIAEAGRIGALDEKTIRLVKLGLAIGALREGAVHANVRKALALGITTDEIEQVIALAAGTHGLSATVAAYSWVQDALSGAKKDQ
jgi:alkylhydroperoxidase/carboxymuconolactone decarboxylase family protein YurZ